MDISKPSSKPVSTSGQPRQQKGSLFKSVSLAAWFGQGGAHKGHQADSSSVQEPSFYEVQEDLEVSAAALPGSERVRLLRRWCEAIRLGQGGRGGNCSSAESDGFISIHGPGMKGVDQGQGSGALQSSPKDMSMDLSEATLPSPRGDPTAFLRMLLSSAALERLVSNYIRNPPDSEEEESLLEELLQLTLVRVPSGMSRGVEDETRSGQQDEERKEILHIILKLASSLAELPVGYEKKEAFCHLAQQTIAHLKLNSEELLFDQQLLHAVRSVQQSQDVTQITTAPPCADELETIASAQRLLECQQGLCELMKKLNLLGRQPSMSSNCYAKCAATVERLSQTSEQTYDQLAVRMAELQVRLKQAQREISQGEEQRLGKFSNLKCRMAQLAEKIGEVEGHKRRLLEELKKVDEELTLLYRQQMDYENERNLYEEGSAMTLEELQAQHWQVDKQYCDQVLEAAVHRDCVKLLNTASSILKKAEAGVGRWRKELLQQSLDSLLAAALTACDHNQHTLACCTWVMTECAEKLNRMHQQHIIDGCRFDDDSHLAKEYREVLKKYRQADAVASQLVSQQMQMQMVLAVPLKGASLQDHPVCNHHTPSLVTPPDVHHARDQQGQQAAGDLARTSSRCLTGHPDVVDYLTALNSNEGTPTDLAAPDVVSRSGSQDAKFVLDSDDEGGEGAEPLGLEGGYRGESTSSPGPDSAGRTGPSPAVSGGVLGGTGRDQPAAFASNWYVNGSGGHHPHKQSNGVQQIHYQQNSVPAPLSSGRPPLGCSRSLELTNLLHVKMAEIDDQVHAYRNMARPMSLLGEDVAEDQLSGTLSIAMHESSVFLTGCSSLEEFLQVQGDQALSIPVSTHNPALVSYSSLMSDPLDSGGMGTSQVGSSISLASRWPLAPPSVRTLSRRDSLQGSHAAGNWSSLSS